MNTDPLTAKHQPSIRAFFQPRQPCSEVALKAGQGEPRCETPLTSPAPSSTPQYRVISQLSDSKNLPKQANITPITQATIQPLRRINALLLPISYPDSFYHQAISGDPSTTFSHVILWSDPEPKVVGGIICRLEDPVSHEFRLTDAPLETDRCYDIYIQSLALLSPYCGKGLAAEALRRVVDAATSNPRLRIGSIFAHVWTDNTEALNWYSSRGFHREEQALHGYYRHLKPDTAWIVRRRLTPTDYLGASTLPHESAFAAPHPKMNGKILHPSISAHSFQDKGPEREWNDLPDDVLDKSGPRVQNCSMLKETDLQSSDSTGRVEVISKAKKKRIYPAAAFGC
ncbi:Acyltransferase domain-containing protein [Blumeria hordei DH14]|uniref:Acyltransferase domain-containing protein n=1 Tax=Blumeria graminis f. sp. hordei (strain DH14) TaxID=546991 RepID=N1J6E8_BLUG1|nr:Acyltransferase domain-containing protein [Blumeria hordei DH14]